MYTTTGEYQEFFKNETAPEPYELNEDLAIIILEEYAFSFPTEEQFKGMEEDYSKQCLRKAIFCQIKHMDDNPEIFAGGVSGGSYSMGRISVNQGTVSLSDKKQMEVGPYAEKYLNASGFVTTGIYVEHACPCDCEVY